MRNKVFNNLESYEVGVFSGIVSGIIVAVTILFFSKLSEKYNIIFGLLGSILVLYLLYHWLVTDNIKQQKKKWDKLGKSIGIEVRSV